MPHPNFSRTMYLRQKRKPARVMLGSARAVEIEEEAGRPDGPRTASTVREGGGGLQG